MPTSKPTQALSDVVPLGKEWIERIRPHLGPEHDNQFLAVDVATGAYEIARDDYSAVTRLRSRNPTAEIFVSRVGRPAAYEMRFSR